MEKLPAGCAAIMNDIAYNGLITTAPVQKCTWWSRWYVRWPVKWAIFVVVVFFVLFPNPAQFARHVRHLSDLQAMVQPDAPEIGELEKTLREQINASQKGAMSSEHIPRQPGDGPLTPIARSMQYKVERFVLNKVQYDWDWNEWGSADYMPTVEEMFRQAKERGGQLREDCDGRAVLAASLMKRMGYDARLVTDLRHVWVETPEGSWMGPGEKTAMKATPQGNRVDVIVAAANAPMALSYGIAVFPLGRELIIAAAAFLLLCRRGMSWKWGFFAGLLIVQGLLFMRLGYLAPHAVSREASSWPSWVGMVHAALGLCILCVAAYPARKNAAEA